MTEPDYVDDRALLTNTSSPAEFLMHRLDQSAIGIRGYINANKSEFISFKKEVTVST